MAQKSDSLQEISSLCKRRGFVFQSSEIYGGLNSCWDYGPLGVELKNNIKRSWWESMTRRPDVEGVDSSILMASRVWEASGHVENFSDPLVDCRKCKARLRADKLEKNDQGELICSSCGSSDLTDQRSFNLMFKTHMGPLEDSSATVYLRPETAQGSYVNFLNVATSMRKKLPFGIAQIGKAFRNEITPGNFIFRTREFEQMEMQFFVKPGTDDEWMETWKQRRWDWHMSLGMNPKKLRFTPHGPGELAHYAKTAFDIEYEFPFGWDEIEGIHNRTDFDLSRHQEYSGKKLLYVDPQNPSEKFIPYIIETAIGAERFFLTTVLNALYEDKENERSVLRFHPKLAPNKVALLPLSKKPELEEIARPLCEELQQNYAVQYDASGSIGKRYRRQDEIGSPFCVTVDFDSVTDKAVTIRHRDSMEQKRVPLEKVSGFIDEAFKNWKIEH